MNDQDHAALEGFLRGHVPSVVSYNDPYVRDSNGSRPMFPVKDGMQLKLEQELFNRKPHKNLFRPKGSIPTHLLPEKEQMKIAHDRYMEGFEKSAAKSLTRNIVRTNPFEPSKLLPNKGKISPNEQLKRSMIDEHMQNLEIMKNPPKDLAAEILARIKDSDQRLTNQFRIKFRKPMPVEKKTGVTIFKNGKKELLITQ
jgi:hypothetical protein